MIQSKRIWLDVTMLAHWQGNLTGIQRVEYNLVRRFAKKDYARFCIFDKVNNNFYEYDFELISAKIKALEHKVTSEAQVNKGYSRTKSIAVKYLPPTIKKGIKKTHIAIKKRRAPTHPNPPISFTKTDTLLILSGDWSDDCFSKYLSNLKSSSSIKIFQIIYDMLPAVQPAFFVPGMPDQFSNYMKAVLGLCDGVLAISEATKKDVIEFKKQNQLTACPVQVFRLGEDFVSQEGQKPDLDIDKKKYILCVGTVEARKNHIAIYYMVREAIRQGLELPPVVIAGKRGWLVDNLFYLIENDQIIKQKIIFINDATDSEIAWLFQNCLFTIYPSLYEGWGLPIAESLFYGKFCLSSNASSMPEIGGSLVEYFSPNDPVSMMELVKKYSNNLKLLNDKESEIRKKYEPTSWDDTFAEVEKRILSA
jgi:glycosyltransferase involved in cell wall biosynthesis